MAPSIYARGQGNIHLGLESKPIVVGRPVAKSDRSRAHVVNLCRIRPRKKRKCPPSAYLVVLSIRDACLVLANSERVFLGLEGDGALVSRS